MFRLDVKVVPKASRNAVVGWIGERLKITVTAAPERGKANEAVIRLLASVLDLPRSRIRVVQGGTRPLKTLGIDGDPALLKSRLPPSSLS